MVHADQRSESGQARAVWNKEVDLLSIEAHAHPLAYRDGRITPSFGNHGFVCHPDMKVGFPAQTLGHYDLA
jgi:hypothetical protein